MVSIVKAPLLVSYALLASPLPTLSVAMMTTNAWFVSALGTVHVYEPSLASLLAISDHELPPLIVYFRVIGVAHNPPVSTIAQLFQVMVRVDHPDRYSPPFGDVSVLLGT